jgi:hypothetical protein
MKKLLLAAGLVLASTSATTTSALAWADQWGHWHEGPQFYGPINPGAVYAPYGVPPAYGYGPPPPAIYGYGTPVIVERPTDTQVAISAGAAVLGAILGR